MEKKDRKKEEENKENKENLSEEIKENKEKLTEENKEIKENKDKEKPSNPNSSNLCDPRKTLYERNFLTKLVYNKLIKKMDDYVFARSLTILSLVAFFLGNNLNIFLNSFILISFYSLGYRVLRFWVKRYLLYLLEFCYFAFLLILYYVSNDSMNKNLFLTCYMCNTGLMSLAIILFNNQTHFSNSDHLTSSWMHTLPLIVNWSIRWRTEIYYEEHLKNLKYNFPDFKDEKIFDSNFFLLLILPFCFWLIWGILYYFVMNIVLRKFTKDEKYRDSLSDFMFFFRNRKFWGDIKQYSMIKFLLQHLIFFFCAYPIGILSFYNFYFNSGYIVFIIMFLGWNTVRNEMKRKRKGIAGQDDY